jgi:hypothetical protein
MVTEIHQDPEAELGGIQVIQNLSAVFVREMRNRFQFDDDFIETDEIRDESLLQRRAFVIEPQDALRVERDTLKPELQRQALMKDRLQKTTAFLLIHLKTCADDAVTFFRVDQISHRFLFVHFVYFVGHVCSVVYTT